MVSEPPSKCATFYNWLSQKTALKRELRRFPFAAIIHPIIRSWWAAGCANSSVVVVMAAWGGGATERCRVCKHWMTTATGKERRYASVAFVACDGIRLIFLRQLHRSDFKSKNPPSCHLQRGAFWMCLNFPWIPWPLCSFFWLDLWWNREAMQRFRQNWQSFLTL